MDNDLSMGQPHALLLYNVRSQSTQVTSMHSHMQRPVCTLGTIRTSVRPRPYVFARPEACVCPRPYVFARPEACVCPRPYVFARPEACVCPRPYVFASAEACVLPRPYVFASADRGLRAPKSRTHQVKCTTNWQEWQDSLYTYVGLQI